MEQKGMVREEAKMEGGVEGSWALPLSHLGVGAEEITLTILAPSGSDPHWKLISAIIFLGALGQSSLP